MATNSGLVLAGGAFVLAAIAALAATLAYADSLRAPRLKWEITGRLLQPERQMPLSEVEPQKPLGETRTPADAVLWFEDGSAITVQPRLINHGNSTARNILVTMTFIGMRVHVLGGGSLFGWAPQDLDTYNYASTFTWDGGLTFAVHGSGRYRYGQHLLLFRFYVTSRVTVPTVKVDVVCDGFDSHKRVTKELRGLRFP
jgi:hypothetical protein